LTCLLKQVTGCVFLKLTLFCHLTAEMSIFADDFIVASNNGTVYLTHQGQSMTSLTGIHDVGVLGFDWLTDTLYWTNNKLNIVSTILVLPPTLLSNVGDLGASFKSKILESGASHCTLCQISVCFCNSW